MPRGRIIAITSVAAVLVAGAAGGGAYYVLHTRGSAQETASAFADAWARGDTAAMRAALAAPAAGFDTAYDRLAKSLGAEKTAVRLGSVTPDGDGRAKAAYTTTLTLKNLGDWTYTGSLDLVVKERHWKVAWTPRAVHPALDGTTSLAVRFRWPERAAIQDSGGRRIDEGGAGPSVEQIVGSLGKATAKQAAKLGWPYKRGDTIGVAGLQQSFQKKLAGVPAAEIQVVDADGEPVRTLKTIEGSPGADVRTSLDPRVQEAAVSTVGGVSKPASMVAIRHSTGEIVAVADNRGGFSRALNGRYPPGSTFKTVTAAALLAEGVTAGQKVTCPKDANVGGLRVRNSEHAAYGSVSFLESFAHSCNTTFAPLAVQRLQGGKLHQMASRLGFNHPLGIGVPVVAGSMPQPTSLAELGAESFGQARITASPLVMASVAAAVADGTWRPPTLVAGLKQKARPYELPEPMARSLRSMMAAVVTRGTADNAGLPKGTSGKTGTAEFGTGPELDSHAWFIGFRGDLSFAVVVEGGGGGGKVAAPVAARFLRGLDAV
ncbi:penicillin-binding transpeptidase domain-containing protein [Sphaerisporangium sp. TRM90804]|uniref:penicillin-binding transpeptidase domain-containing protein n=1 Tax=Sphaerisporangium sp. TRM90804 TaxID=3031113 RepID=UPI0024486823|nr:penicillin-binding transpeptidase domain-containing protein [Sphaerisporangium sp. TRM90804]MDH2426189.1 penicillin-binding transpeptidase domain-containing protein [Sphaerisporangium sp. TRM90804]